VRSIIDRFLEHSRIYYSKTPCQPQVFLAAPIGCREIFSAASKSFPVEDGVLRERIINEVLAMTLADNTRARILSNDGSYAPIEKKAKRTAANLNSSPSPPAKEKNPEPHSAKSKFPVVKVAERPF